MRVRVRELLLIVALAAALLAHALESRRHADAVESLRAELGGWEEDAERGRWWHEREVTELREQVETLEAELEEARAGRQAIESPRGGGDRRGGG